MSPPGRRKGDYCNAPHGRCLMTDLVVVGLAYFEVFVPPHVRPPPGEELFVDGIGLGLGGALNTATVAAALGLQVTMCVPMGHGIVDQAVSALAERQGITLVPLPAPDNPAISLVFSDANDRAFVSSASFDVLADIAPLPPAAWIHVPGLEEADRLAGPLAQARKDGACISVSASWSPRQLERLAQRTGQGWDLLVLNEKEAMAACGDVTTAPQQLARAASSVLVTRGAQGVSGVLNATPVHAYAVPVDMVDATGAGDAFCAGVIAALLRGRAPAAATQCGARAAARIVSQAGGMVTDAAVMAGVFDEDEGGLWKS
jgi:sugar/nucleoside kinase (ribokinase family)